MKFFGIVCEFNPFHRGHKYLIEQTRLNTSCDGIVCAMSGSVVQRGDIAIYDKWTRAKSAIENGADLVVEIPACYVLQSAEIYAKGAVKILSGMGAYGISFGSECTDTELLTAMAKLKANQPTEYKAELNKALSEGLGYPAACERASEAALGTLPKEVLSPNATLGISYMSNAMKINPDLKFNIVKRIGSYHDTEDTGEFASATSIRKRILSGDFDKADLLCRSEDIYDINSISDFIIGFFRTSDESRLSGICGMEEGLPSRLINASKECVNLDEFVDACVSKRHTRHRIRRLILCSILGIRETPPPSYIRVLALNSKGASILKEIKQNSDMEIITKIGNSDAKNTKMLKQDIMATDIASLCLKKKASMDYFTSPIVL